MTMSARRCTREGCRVSDTGNCLEGFALEECPYLEAAETGQDVAVADADHVALRTAEALTLEEAAEVTRAAATTVIVIAGPIKSGKTTLLTSIYESFQQAPFAGHLFSGSHTLVGFERRCHEGRISSGRQAAETPRTPQEDGVAFLHLRLARLEEPHAPPAELLLSDVSGEHFRRIRDSADAAADFRVLSRADRFCLALDGEKLASPQTRQLPRNDARALLRSILDAKILSRQCPIDVVFTKWDAVLEATDASATQGFVDETKAVLQATCSSAGVAAPRFFEVAARPRSVQHPFAQGMGSLLRAWTERVTPPWRPQLLLPKPRAGEREAYQSVLGASSILQLERLYELIWA